MKNIAVNSKKHLFRFGLICSVFAIAISTLAFVSSSSNTTYWYVDGIRDNWFMQQDVYAFTTTDGSRYTGYVDNAVVSNIDFQNGLNLVYFKNQASEWERDRQIRNITKEADFDHANPVVTRFTMAPYNEGLWYVAGENVLVTFHQGKADAQTISYISQKYDLKLVNDPSELPGGGTYSYIFARNETQYQNQDIIELAREMYLQDSTVVYNVEPDLMRIYDINTTVEETTNQVNAGGEDKFYMVNEHNTSLEAYYTVYSTDKPLEFIITDLFGRNMYVGKLGRGGRSASHIVDIAYLPTGTYFGTIIASDGKVIDSRKFQKL